MADAGTETCDGDGGGSSTTTHHEGGSCGAAAIPEGGTLDSGRSSPGRSTHSTSNCSRRARSEESLRPRRSGSRDEAGTGGDGGGDGGGTDWMYNNGADPEEEEEEELDPESDPNEEEDDDDDDLEHFICMQNEE